MVRHRWLMAFVLLGLVGGTTGCNKKTGGGDPPPPVVPSGSPPASGPKGLFDVHCAKCHVIDGSSKKGKGPDLSHVGSEPGRTAEWLADHIRDPKSHKPTSTMPAFGGKLDHEQIQALADFLAGLK
jgi:mono/diheme cytochrome c family protein